MPKVKKVKAQKDYPQFGIKKGDIHYYAQMKTGPYSSKTMRQITPFTRSQLTSSEFLSAVYGIEDSLVGLTTPDDLESIIEELQNLGYEQQDKFDNMPEGLQQGATGDLIQERAAACETAAGELEEIKSEWESALEDHEKSDDEFDASEYTDRISNVAIEV